MYNENNNLFEPYQGFVRGNMFQNLYSQYGKIYDVKPMNEQAELLTYIDVLDFACIDLDLYLDVFPDNSKMIQFYNQLMNEKKKAEAKYEEMYGPISLSSNTLNTMPWAWIICPWPWEA